MPGVEFHRARVLDGPFEHEQIAGPEPRPDLRRHHRDRARRGRQREAGRHRRDQQEHHPRHRPRAHARGAPRRRDGQHRRAREQHHRGPRHQRLQRRPRGIGRRLPERRLLARVHVGDAEHRLREGLPIARGGPRAARSREQEEREVRRDEAARTRRHVAPRARREQCQRGIGGQAVMGQLERRDREEGQHAHRPHRESHPRQLRGIAPGPRTNERAHRHQRGQDPRERPEAGRGQELQRGERHVLVGELPHPRDIQHVVVHHRVPEERGLGHRGHRVPAEADGDHERDADGRQPRAHRPEAPRQRHRDRDGPERPEQPQRILRQRRDTQRNTAENGPASAGASARGLGTSVRHWGSAGAISGPPHMESLRK